MEKYDMKWLDSVLFTINPIKRFCPMSWWSIEYYWHGQPSRQAGREERCPMSVDADSFQSGLFWRRLKLQTNIYVQTCPHAYLVHFFQPSFKVKFIEINQISRCLKFIIYGLDVRKTEMTEGIVCWKLQCSNIFS